MMGEAMSRRIRGVFNAANFWAIVLYNVLSLNSLEFAKLVGRRLIFKGGEQQGCIIQNQTILSVLVKSENNSGRHQKQQNLKGNLLPDIT